VSDQIDVAAVQIAVKLPDQAREKCHEHLAMLVGRHVGEFVGFNSGF